MSEFISYRTVKGVFDLKDSETLSLVKIGRFQVVHNREEAHQLTMGQQVVHVPNGIILGGTTKVVGMRILGAPSYGFILPHCTIEEEKLDDYFDVSYVPQSIQRVQLKPEAWTEGLPVRVTEKVRGLKCNFTVEKVNGDWEYLCWPNSSKELLDENVMGLLNHLCDGERPVTIHGVKLGVGPLDYGFTEPKLKVFDIDIDNEYLPFDLLQTFCEMFNIDLVPILYTGGFSWCLVDNMTDGGSTVANPSTYRSFFKGRQGIVITPLQETESEFLGGRLIGKSISCDYEEIFHG